MGFDRWPRTESSEDHSCEKNENQPEADQLEQLRQGPFTYKNYKVSINRELINKLEAWYKINIRYPKTKYK